MSDTSVVDHLAHNMTPTTGMPEWYFAILVVGIVGLILGWRYISLKFAPQAITTQPAQATQQPELNSLERIIMSEMNSLRELVDVKFEGLEARVDSQLDGFRTALKESEIREEVRMSDISKQMAAGFLAVHERIDRHIDSEKKQSLGGQ